MESNYLGCDLEIYPMRISPFLPFEYYNELMIAGQNIGDFDRDRILYADDYKNHEYRQFYRQCFASTLNEWGLEERQGGDIFIEYQHRNNFHQEDHLYFTLLRNFLEESENYLVNSSYLVIDEYLNKHDPTRRVNTGSLIEKNFYLKAVLEMAAKEAVSTALEKAKGRIESINVDNIKCNIPEIVIARLFLFLTDDHKYSESKSRIHADNHKGKIVFSSRGELSKEQKEKFKNRLSGCLSEDKISKK